MWNHFGKLDIEGLAGLLVALPALVLAILGCLGLAAKDPRWTVQLFWYLLAAGLVMILFYLFFQVLVFDTGTETKWKSRAADQAWREKHPLFAQYVDIMMEARRGR